jgi:D-lactate dehydrogenase (cytochrome)
MSTVTTPVEQTVDELRARFGPRLQTSADVLQQHATGESSYHEPAPPAAVVFPETTDEVAEIVKICARHRTPIVPFGAGTSIEGNVHALQSGVSIDLTGMNRIVSVNAEDMDATVEAGVTRLQLERHLKDFGLFFPVDPGADATLGGMASTSASGTLTVRYGTMRENVLSLKVVLADGRVIRTSSRARKSAAGYDLTRLFVGSEGTLGVITELTLRLFGIPEAIAAAVCTFPDIGAAVSCGMQIAQLGIPVARMEFLDEVSIDAVNRHGGFDYPLLPTLFFEFHGTDAGVAEQSEAAGEIARELGGTDFTWATRAEERNQLWRARHHAYYACLALRPGTKGFVTDVCVPISHLARSVIDVRQDLDASSLPAPTPILGHIGDGNFHLIMLVDPANQEEIAEVKRINEGMVMRALEAGGTCTGEHGVGSGKIGAMEREHGPDTIGVMRSVKQALDPDGILNPGKIFRADA